MKKNDMKDGIRRRGFYISLMAGAICVVAIAAVCLNTFGRDNNSKQLEINEPAKVADNGGENGDSTELNNITGAEGVVNGKDAAKVDNNAKTDITNQAAATPGDKKKSESDKKDKADKDKADKDVAKKKDINKTADTEKSKEITVMESGNNVSNLKFDQESGLKWPVEGEILMQYSADSAVYFKTLGQYKSNPALLISASKGSNVCSAADAVVTAVGKNEEIGNYIETLIGDDYKIIYGQLDKVQVKKGSAVKEGELIGCVAAPTKYYVEEGSNLYMQMKCADETVDPMIFLQ